MTKRRSRYRFEDVPARTTWHGFSPSHAGLVVSLVALGISTGAFAAAIAAIGSAKVSS